MIKAELKENGVQIEVSGTKPDIIAEAIAVCTQSCVTIANFTGMNPEAALYAMVMQVGKNMIGNGYAIDIKRVGQHIVDEDI